MLSHIPSKILKTCTIPPSITGEWWSRLSLGLRVKIGENTNILAHGGVMIGEDVKIGKDAQIITVGHGLHPTQRFLSRCAPIIIEDGAVIGNNVKIVNTCQSSGPLVIGKGATVLSGSIVTANVPDSAMVGGVQAKCISDLSEKLRVSFAQAGHPPDCTGCKKISHFEEGLAISPNVRVIAPIYLRKPEHVSFGDNCFINRNGVIYAEGKVNIGPNLQMAPCATIKSEKDAT